LTGFSELPQTARDKKMNAKPDMRADAKPLHKNGEAAMSTDPIEFRMAWWFKLYVFGVSTMCLLTACEPQQEKSLYWCQKAIRASCNGKRIKIS
jgi:hypothetical protein